MSDAGVPLKRTNSPDIRRLLLKIFAYYGGLTVLMLILANVAPAFFDTLPFGGVAQLSGPNLTELAFEDALLNGDDDDMETAAKAPVLRLQRFEDAKLLLYAMMGALLIMIPVAWVHRAIHVGDEHDHSLDETAMILPSVVAGIVLIVQHSLALAFSLAGIVAGVQFRRALTDTFDTLFVFVAIGVGIAAGIKALDIGFVLAVFFCFATLIISLNSDGLESHFQVQKKAEKAERAAQQERAKLAEIAAAATRPEDEPK